MIPIRNLMAGEGGQGDNLRHQTKRTLQNLGNVRKKKMENLKIFEQFEYSPDMLGTFHWQKP